MISQSVQTPEGRGTRDTRKTSPSRDAEVGSIIKAIHAPKGIGIGEQNIYQIICKSPDLSREKSPYFLEFVSQKLEGRDQEV